MSFDLYTRVLDALTYAVNSSAHRRDPKNASELLVTRDRFAVAFPEHRNKYVPAGDR